jgi:hypothetical protein
MPLCYQCEGTLFIKRMKYALCGEMNGDEFIARLQKDNLFLIALDNEKGNRRCRENAKSDDQIPGKQIGCRRSRVFVRGTLSPNC